MENTVTTILGLITTTLQLIKPNKDSQNRRNIRMAFRNYRKIKKMMKKNDGKIDAHEKEQLANLMDQLIEAQATLL